MSLGLISDQAVDDWLERNPGGIEGNRDPRQRAAWKIAYEEKAKAAGRKHYKKKTKALLEARVCHDCKSPKLKNRWYCADCDAIRRARMAARRSAKKAAGVCTAGGCTRLVVSGYVRCEPCLVKHRREGRDWRFKQYGMTHDDYAKMLEAQGGCCAVCYGQSDKWHIDHCHETNKVRGILCHNCNLAIGHGREDDKILRALADYVVLHRFLNQKAS